MRWLWAVLFALLPVAAQAACESVSYENTGLTVCTVHAGEELRLFHSGPDGIYGSFSAVNAALEPSGKRLGFAMNAGMYAPDRSPLGLYIENGQEKHRIVTTEGPGNFGMMPNGVFCLSDAGFSITESRAFAAQPPACKQATQSGPMLVIDGALHPRFLENSDSLYIRNGVGVSADGQTAWFVISDQPVTFHLFARYFRDALRVPDALYLDGSISRLYAPDLGRSDLGWPMGPIIGTVVPLD